MKQSSLKIVNTRQPVTWVVAEPDSQCICRSLLRLSSIVIYAMGLVGCLYSGAESVGYMHTIMTDGILLMLALASAVMFGVGLTGAVTSSAERLVLLNLPVLTSFALLVYSLDRAANLLNDESTDTMNPMDSFTLGDALEESKEFKDRLYLQLSAGFVLTVVSSALMAFQLLTALLLLCQRKRLYPVPI
jgi:hypothetical protein